MQPRIVIELSEILRNLVVRTQNEKIKFVNFISSLFLTSYAFFELTDHLLMTNKTLMSTLRGFCVGLCVTLLSQTSVFSKAKAQLEALAE